MKVLLVTNMYPYSGKAWLGAFVKEQFSWLKDNHLINCDKFVFKANSFGRSRLNYIFKLPSYLLYCIRFRPQIIHSHHYITTLLTRIFWYRKLIYTVHEGELQQGGMQAWFIRLAIKLSSSVIFVNQDMYQHSSKKKKAFLPCGVNVQKFYPIEKQRARQQLGLEFDCLYLFFPADKQRQEKNPHFLKVFIEQNQNFIADNNIKVIWGGAINYDDMPLYMNAADLLVQFSHFESDGMVIKEAMSCNLPVISFAVGNAELYLDGSVAGSIIKDDTTELKQKIVFWKKQQSTGREKIYSLTMDSKSVGEQLIKIYHSV